MRIPIELRTDDVTAAAATLTEYFGGAASGNDPFPSNRYTGASFDSWDSTGTRVADADRFTADDFVAIGMLSVNAGPRAARILLRDEAAEFSDLLQAIGDDRDLGDVDEVIDDSWPAWKLEARLRSVPGIGLTIASKLIARKRPKLYPIWDDVVTGVMGTRKAHLVPIHEALRDGSGLRERLRAARAEAELPDVISELRVLDVVAWMEGKRSKSAQR
ncbi:DUF6308 family protein [Gordonia phosphorivorans]|uniref:DUF6308 family protein n=1 Tax=Gordonia phosphorivorans TaxID=1056982 RepID=A0ABV6H780_9ACTN